MTDVFFRFPALSYYKSRQEAKTVVEPVPLFSLQAVITFHDLLITVYIREGEF